MVSGLPDLRSKGKQHPKWSQCLVERDRSHPVSCISAVPGWFASAGFPGNTFLTLPPRVSYVRGGGCLACQGFAVEF